MLSIMKVYACFVVLLSLDSRSPRLCTSENLRAIGWGKRDYHTDTAVFLRKHVGARYEKYFISGDRHLVMWRPPLS